MRRLWKLVSNEKLFEKPCEDNNDNRYPQWHVQGLLHPPTTNFWSITPPFVENVKKQTTTANILPQDTVLVPYLPSGIK